MKGKVIVITGPTASGKSALAVDLAARLDTEIVSADSRQIYRGIPIVTAMPTAGQRARVRHHLIDMLGLHEYYSASRFEEDALQIVYRLLEERGVAVVCGGSMMYVDAFCRGLDSLPTVPDSIRTSLMAEHAERGDEWLLEELRRIDPEYHAVVDRCNIKRVFHAVEIVRTAGVTYTSLRTGRRVKRDFEIEKRVIDLPREELFGRINARVDEMVRAGLEEEAHRVYPLRHLNSLNTVGLKEMFAWFDGVMSREQAIERIKKNTRVYAKKQLTWLKKSSLH
ncbi:MAG: tRNA (adenosine(37)-N6)-dimethylallyltransferase MiaA [Candidatus Amulumruptor caecigallinarius]|nr:tRNA (adenosine(37)-N6)-dimethylallyltransferase MiaA [Candidatus Amulumruptor caecigallinarius]